MKLRFALGVVLAGLLMGAGVAQVAPAPAAQTQEQMDKQERRFQKQIEALLVEEKFDDLDRMADLFRREKTRLPGGGWRLRQMYGLLDAPQLTDKDSIDHLAHLANWMKLRPESITARVAMATSLTRWAWVARGNGRANTVTDEGWRLFKERAEKAQGILEGARDMRQMCPQWYAEEMTVGLALGWSVSREREVFERGVQFEPEYFYLYTEFANFQLPKWYGEPGDAARFAKKSADKLGGGDGDILYYLMAETIIRRGSRNADANGNASVKDVDWQRVQRGYAANAAKFGATGKGLNELALLAYIFRDRPVLQTEFAAIGEGWNKSVWTDRKFFDRARDWAGGRAGASDPD